MTVQRAEIEAAYRVLLGSEPSTQELEQLSATPNHAALRDALLHAQAFMRALPADVAQLPADTPQMEIELKVDGPAGQMLLARVASQWTRIGQIRPHWSVNAQPEFMPSEIGSHGEAFAQSGRTDRDAMLACLARNEIDPACLRTVCDFGCGVGRVTLPLASRFHRVIGCDVSGPHLHVARAAASAAGLRNVLFSLVDIDSFGMAEPFDLWYSRFVLQHNPPPIMQRILCRAFSLLAPGGIALFQLPTYLLGYRFCAHAYLAATFDNATEDLHALPQHVVFRLAAEAGCVPMEVREDAALWPPTQCTSCTFLFRKER